jgi:hypothetical protein
MQKILKIFDWKTYTFTAIAVIGFSNIVVELFSQTIPNVMITFFRNAGEVVILGSVFLFAIAWLVRARRSPSSARKRSSPGEAKRPRNRSPVLHNPR